jgi:tetratricopeptide (TPR) repeat protein
MKKAKDVIVGILVVAVIVTIGLFVYRFDKNRTHRDLAKRIAELSPRGGTPETIDGLRQAIALYEAQIETNVRDGAQTGTYWKILGIRLADRNMDRDALGAFEKAVYYNSGDPTIFYLTGVSAGRVAKSVVGFSSGSAAERDQFFTLAENSYRRALDLDPQYYKPMYGLGILYIFELDRPQEAIPYMEKYVQYQANDVSAMFVLARAYYMTENYQQAIEMYDRIIAKTKDAKVRSEAQSNRDIVMGQIYG